jgi:hypothetical protein
MERHSYRHGDSSRDAALPQHEPGRLSAATDSTVEVDQRANAVICFSSLGGAPAVWGHTFRKG